MVARRPLTPSVWVQFPGPLPNRKDKMASIPLFISILSFLIIIYKDESNYTDFDLVTLTLSVLIGVQYLISWLYLLFFSIIALILFASIILRYGLGNYSTNGLFFDVLLMLVAAALAIKSWAELVAI